jgi:predicted PurR-regulated permease PerM
MLGLDRRAARYAWTVAVIVLLLVLVYLVRTTLFVFALALLFAHLLSPLVNFLDRVLPSSRTRTPALGLTYVILVGVLTLIGIQIGTRVVEQAGNLSQRLPQMLANFQKPRPAPAAPLLSSLKEQILVRAQTEIASRSSDILDALSRAGLKALTVASNLIYVVIVPIVAFFFLKDGHLIRDNLLDMVEDGGRRALLADVLAEAHQLLTHYIRALVLLSLAAFTAYSIFFEITGLSYAILLAALAALLEFIPMLGPLAAAIVILVVAGISGGPVLTILIFLLVYRVFQDYVLSPHFMGQGVELHPLLVLFGVFAGAEVAGIAGTFLSVPVLALARILFLRLRKARLDAQLATPPAATLRP